MVLGIRLRPTHMVGKHSTLTVSIFWHAVRSTILHCDVTLLVCFRFCQVWLHPSVILVHRRPRQDNKHRGQASLGYRVRVCLRKASSGAFPVPGFRMTDAQPVIASCQHRFFPNSKWYTKIYCQMSSCRLAIREHLLIYWFVVEA